jgi:hypothetical protein
MIPVKILIPVHRNTLTNEEWKSLSRCINVLGHYHVSLVIPQSLDARVIFSRYPTLHKETFPDEYFQGIEGYNRLMLSEEFYERFSDTTYILIYQLDAWVFRDELDFWMKKGYDYAGAPWVKKPKYSSWYYPLFVKIRTSVLRKPLKSNQLSGKSGNGGLSLRKVSSHLEVVKSRKEEIQKQLTHAEKSDLFNEDVFWSLENPGFKYPSYEEALQFAWDQHPEICLKQAGGKIPFGCHGWSKTADLIRFWQKFMG